MARGDDSVIDFFCLPLKLGGYETLFGVEPTQYRDWATHPREWQMLCSRCRVDVEGMREITKRLSKFPLPEIEYRNFELSEEINDRGVYTDPILVQGAGIVVEKEFLNLRKSFTELTGLSNPRSTKAVLAYLRQHGYTFTSLNKQYANRALKGEGNLVAMYYQRIRCSKIYCYLLGKEFKKA